MDMFRATGGDFASAFHATPEVIGVPDEPQAKVSTSPPTDGT
jgi:hypothetical protein